MKMLILNKTFVSLKRFEFKRWTWQNLHEFLNLVQA